MSAIGWPLRMILEAANLLRWASRFLPLLWSWLLANQHLGSLFWSGNGVGWVNAWLIPHHHPSPLAKRETASRIITTPPWRPEPTQLVSCGTIKATSLRAESMARGDDQGSTWGGNEETLLEAQWLDVYQAVARQDPKWFHQFVLDSLPEPERTRLVSALESAPQREFRFDSENQGIIRETDENSPLIVATWDVETKRSESGKDVKSRLGDGEDVDDARLPSGLEPAAWVKRDRPLDQIVIDSKRDVGNRQAPPVASTPEPFVSFDVPLLEEEDKTPSDLFVLYFDVDMESWRKIPLATVAELGYTRADIPMLRTEVLSVIAEDQIAKPRSGIPPRWKLDQPANQAPESQARVLSRQEVTDFLKKVQLDRKAGTRLLDKEAPASQEIASKMVDGVKRSSVKRGQGGTWNQTPGAFSEDLLSGSPANGDNKFQLETGAPPVARQANVQPVPDRRINTISKEVDSRSSRPTEYRMDDPIAAEVKEMEKTRRKMRDQNQNTSGRGRLSDRSDESSARSESQRDNPGRGERRAVNRYPDEPRTVYTGRRSSPADSRSSPIMDPPNPKSFLWPDVESFRSLLRNEASLRLRILGNDWSDVVKQESDWRLDLYKQWLWTLHRGWGDPIVESRSSRAMRRNPRDRASASDVNRNMGKSTERED